MEAELIQLLKFADEAIGRYITFYMTGIAVLAILVMSEGYKKRFKVLGKVILSIALAGLAFGDWSTLVYYQQIYNQTIVALQGSVTNLDYLFGPIDGALQPKPMWHIHVGHTMGAIIGFSLIWWIEIQTTIRNRLTNRANKLKRRGR